MGKFKAGVLTYFALALFASPSFAVSDMPVQSVFETSDTPLTTEKIWELDPQELNPHRQNWVLSRSVELMGLRALPVSGQKQFFKVSVDSVSARSTLYLRGPGGWYRPLTDLGCKKESNAWFSTIDGARVAGSTANTYWDGLLSGKRLKLSFMLTHLSAPTEAQALSEAKRIFTSWLLDLEFEWLAHGKKVARDAEWKSYLDQLAANLNPACSEGGAVQVAVPHFKEMMEPVPNNAPDRLKPFFARVPAKRWNGLYVIHATINLAGKKLNGQFLIDSGSARSLISPTFLSAQGVPPALLALNGLKSEKVMWSGGSGMAKPIGGFDVEVGGKITALKSMMMLDTNLFSPPAYLQGCCSGVLGIDFLREYAVQFVTGTPVELKLWNRAGYYEGAAHPWVQVSTTVTGDVISSDCIAESNLAHKNSTSVVGTRWDTGNDMAMELHSALHHPQSPRREEWSLLCGELKGPVAGDIPVSIQDKTGTRFSHHLIANVGMKLLGRGDFTLDLSHGRLWFAPEGINAPVLANRTGLTLKFVLNENDDRELQVIKIEPGSIADRTLSPLGFRPGMMISEVDGHHSIDMDIWQVNQRLAGAFSDSVTLLWRLKRVKNENEMETTSFKVRDKHLEVAK